MKWGNTRLRVALVLDNTGSMSSAGKLTALKTATTSLLGQLQTAAAKDGDVYVSIIPFVKDVAVDPTTNYQRELDRLDGLARRATGARHHQERIEAQQLVHDRFRLDLSSSPAIRTGFVCAQNATSTSTMTTISSSGNYKGLHLPRHRQWEQEARSRTA